MNDWVIVAQEGDLPEGASAVVTIHGKAIALFHIGGKYYAIDDVCPHAGASLAAGEVEDLIVTCPWHFWRFRISDGTWVNNPRIKTGCYEVRVEENQIWIKVPQSSGK